MTPRASARSARDGLGVAEEAAVWRAARTGRQTFVRKRQCNVALTGSEGRLGQDPVHDAAFRVAAADLRYQFTAASVAPER